jgi:hypothetical protein
MRSTARLNLSRETVRLLADEDMAGAAAGNITGSACPVLLITTQVCARLSLTYVNTGCCPGGSLAIC